MRSLLEGVYREESRGPRKDGNFKVKRLDGWEGTSQGDDRYEGSELRGSKQRV